jgi:hypothetical protein
VKGDGTVVDSIPGMPAFESGVSPYLRIIAVNGRAFSVDELNRAIAGSRSSAGTIVITATNTGAIETHEIHYQGGNRYPHLERIGGTADYLSDILKPLIPAKSH